MCGAEMFELNPIGAGLKINTKIKIFTNQYKEACQQNRLYQQIS